MARPHLFRKTGAEVFGFDGRPTGHSLLDFWRWSVSDLVSNATRGVVAEYIVGIALGVDFARVRDEWQAWDLTLPNGLKIEVKSAAYVQSWEQAKPSAISFSIKGAKPENFKAGEEVADVRHSDVYVFCLLAHADPTTIDPMKLEQWRFWSVATQVVDGYVRSQHSITVPSLNRLVAQCPDGAAGPMTWQDLSASVLRHPAKGEQRFACWRGSRSDGVD